MKRPKSSRAGTLYLGTSGFAYDAWKGSFYPADIKAKGMLSFYAGKFPSVEINYTFQRLPSPAALATWCAATPASFVFAIKAHKRITHILRLAGAEAAVAEFFEALKPLGGRTGPILFQCPPNLKVDRARLEPFLDLLPKGGRYAFEFRNAASIETRSLLESRGVGWCVAETDEAEADDDALATGPFGYLRLRKTKYTAAQLVRWAKRIDAALTSGRDVFCFFKHEETGSGPRYANALKKAVAAVHGGH